MKKLAKIFLCLTLALMMSLSLMVPTFANYCSHEYYTTESEWYTDNGALTHTKHYQTATRCKKCNYKKAGVEQTSPENHSASRYAYSSSNHSSSNPANHYCIKKLLCEKCPHAFTSDRVSTGCTASGCREYQSVNPVPVTE